MNNSILSLCWFLAAVSCCSAIFCDTCNPEQCPETVNCTAGVVMDSCQCCQVCGIPEGEPCNTQDIGLCADEKFCLPDGGLFSNSITGKCLDITDCFATGCNIVEDECHCGYSNSCPTKLYPFEDIITCEGSKADSTENQTSCSTLDPLSQCEAGQICLSKHDKITLGTCQEISPCINYGCEIVGAECECRFSNSCPLVQLAYFTMDECQAGLASTCQDVQCTPEPSCPEGTYYEPGPQALGECCPTEGVCLCNSSLCSLEPDCPEGTEALLVISADAEACCDVYQCKQVQCEFQGKVIANHEVVKPDDCTTCSCADGELVCATIECYPPQCGEDEELVLQAGNCCPYCHPLPVIDEPDTSSCEQEKYAIENNPCHVCFCQNGLLACTEELCGPFNCENPVYLPGVCCPVCENPETDSPFTSSEKTQTPLTTVTSSESPSKPVDKSTESVSTTAVIEETTTEERPGNVLIIDIFSKIPPCSRPGRYRNQENPCLTCQCINGIERCVDQSDLCGDMSCEDPIKIEGQCCPICKDTHMQTTEYSTPPPATTVIDIIPSVTITILMETSVDNMREVQENIVQQIDEDLEDYGYTLVQIKAIAFGKTQVELVIVVKGSPVLSEDDLTKFLTDRISAVMPGKTEAVTSINTTIPKKTFEPAVMPGNTIIIVSVLVVIIVISLLGISALAVFLLRQRKRVVSKTVVSV